jgi:uncharacterized membrane protein HdeD (DUF308 family)
MPVALARPMLIGDRQTHQPPEVFVIILGLILLLIGLFAKINILLWLGIILVVVGLVLVLLGSTGRAVGGRKHFF